MGLVDKVGPTALGRMPAAHPVWWVGLPNSEFQCCCVSESSQVPGLGLDSFLSDRVLVEWPRVVVPAVLGDASKRQRRSADLEEGSFSRAACTHACVCVCARSDSTDLPRLEASLAMTRPSSELFD